MGNAFVTHHPQIAIERLLKLAAEVPDALVTGRRDGQPVLYSVDLALKPPNGGTEAVDHHGQKLESARVAELVLAAAEMRT